MKTKLFLIISFFFAITAKAQWYKVEQIPDVDIYSIYIEGDSIYAGADSVVYISYDAGNNWFPSGKLADGVDAVTALIRFKGFLLAGTYNYGVFMSVDDGKHWGPVNDGLVGIGADDISDFAIRGDSLYVSTIGASVFVTDLERPRTWHKYNTGIPSNTSYNTESIYNFNNTLVAGAGGNATVYLNNYSDASWNEVYFSTVNQNPKIMLSINSIDGILVGVSTEGLFYSTDSGQTWIESENWFMYVEEADIFSTGKDLIVSKSKRETYLLQFNPKTYVFNYLDAKENFVTTSIGVLNNKIYTGTIGQGLWFIHYAPTSVKDKNKINKDFTLYQNYPNPFNPTTTIKYSVDSKSPVIVQIKVYDVLGNEISILINEEKYAGNYETNFSAVNLASGNYFYRISVSDGNNLLFSETKQMTLLK